MDMRKLVGRNFGRLRRAKGLTQEEVEARSGFSQQYLSGLERGRRNPTVITLFELAQALEVNLVDLVQQDQSTCAFDQDRRCRPSGECR
jgi:transcriptional regulator with XRE-family HTH domain